MYNLKDLNNNELLKLKEKKEQEIGKIILEMRFNAEIEKIEKEILNIEEEIKIRKDSK